MKISVLFTGGTISSAVNENGYIAPKSVERYKLLDEYENRRNAEIKPVAVCSVLSENIGSEHLQVIARAIKSELETDCDGIVLTHGTDTLQYTAAFLSYVFADCKKPIVLVSSNYILSDKRANGAENFAAAVDFLAQHKTGGVFVAYKNSGSLPEIHRGTRLLPHLPYSDSVFSLNGEPFGNIVDGVFKENLQYQAQKDEMRPLSAENLGDFSFVLSLQVQPLALYPSIPKCSRAVLINAYHSGTLNTENDAFKAFCQQVQEKQLPFFVVGAENTRAYESSACYSELGIITLPKMSPIAAYVKLTLLLSNGKELSEMNKSLAEDLL